MSCQLMAGLVADKKYSDDWAWQCDIVTLAGVQVTILPSVGTRILVRIPKIDLKLAEPPV